MHAIMEFLNSSLGVVTGLLTIVGILYNTWKNHSHKIKTKSQRLDDLIKLLPANANKANDVLSDIKTAHIFQEGMGIYLENSQFELLCEFKELCNERVRWSSLNKVADFIERDADGKPFVRKMTIFEIIADIGQGFIILVYVAVLDMGLNLLKEHWLQLPLQNIVKLLFLESGVMVLLIYFLTNMRSLHVGYIKRNLKRSIKTQAVEDQETVRALLIRESNQQAAVPPQLEQTAIRETIDAHKVSQIEPAPAMIQRIVEKNREV